MDINKEKQQRKEFCQILYDLAETQTLLQNSSERSKIYQRLENLYHSSDNENKFRHFYSDLFSVLTQIQQGDKTGSIEILGQNLYEIRKGYQPKNTDKNGMLIDVSNNIRKLYDHVSLDIARITYSEGADRKLSQEESLINIRTDVKNMQEHLNSVKHNLNNDLQLIKSKMQSMQKEYITILGIFSGIVFAFAGGMIFTSSVLENMHKGNIYRALLVIDLLTIFIGNLVYLLFKFIFVINDSSNKNYKKLKISWINLALVGFAFLVILSWGIDIKALQNFFSGILPWKK